MARLLWYIEITYHALPVAAGAICLLLRAVHASGTVLLRLPLRPLRALRHSPQHAHDLEADLVLERVHALRHAEHARHLALQLVAHQQQ